MDVLPTFTPDIQISAPIEVEMTNHQFRRDKSAIDMIKGVAGADNSRRASRIRRQRLKTTARLAAPAESLTASIGKTGEYIRPSAKVEADLGAQVSAGDENSEESTETSPFAGEKLGWNHARASSYGSLNTITEDSVTAPLLGATSCICCAAPAIFSTDIEHGTSPHYAQSAIYSWNKWMKIYIGFLLAIFLTLGVLIAIGKVAGSHRKKTAEGGNASNKSSAGSTEIPSFWYTLALAMAVGFADLIFGGGLGDL